MKPCGKFWYATKAAAERKVEEMRRQPTVKKPHYLGSYFCEECEGWHVGHSFTNALLSLCIGEHK